jgi:hypothetical protein
VGSPLEAEVRLNIAANSKLLKPLEALHEELACFFGAVSRAVISEEKAQEKSKYQETLTLQDGSEQVVVTVAPIEGNKCPRCWVRGDFQHFCQRCDVLERK